jgi:hypothetical protein
MSFNVEEKLAYMSANVFPVKIVKRLVRLVVSEEGGIFPCCGVQYALPNPNKDYEPLMRMGSIQNMPHLVKQQAFCDGCKCVRCYYSEYNQLLRLLLTRVNYLNFV